MTEYEGEAEHSQATPSMRTHSSPSHSDHGSEFHAIMRKGRTEWEGNLVVFLLAERERYECARSTRAIEDQPGYP